MNTNESAASELRYAFPKTVPVMVGYLFLGAAYGILMHVNGYGILWTVCTSLLVFAGSLQYLGITLLVTAVHPLTALFMSVMLNARHLFYGVSLLKKYSGFENKLLKLYAIFGLSDETFSIIVSEDPPAGLNRDKVYAWITLLDQSYWVLGSAIGAIAGQFLTVSTTGLDFTLTALFVVIFTDQWKQKEGHMPALLGIAASILCILLFGRDSFIVPAMFLICAMLGLDYKRKGETA